MFHNVHMTLSKKNIIYNRKHIPNTSAEFKKSFKQDSLNLDLCSCV